MLQWLGLLTLPFFSYIASYPIDTVRRRMMMTSGAAVKYDSSLHCFREVIKNEGYKSLFKGAGANILRAIAGAGVLSGYVVFPRFMTLTSTDLLTTHPFFTVTISSRSSCSERSTKCSTLLMERYMIILWAAIESISLLSVHFLPYIVPVV